MNRDPYGTGELFTVDTPKAPIDGHLQALLGLVRGNPLHDNDRHRIVEAIVDEANAHSGRVNPNRVRARLTHPVSEELDVNPRVVGAVYSALAGAGVLAFDDFVLNTDRRGGNAGKPCRAYRLTRIPAERDHR